VVAIDNNWTKIFNLDP